jgi:hypothetical protein
MNSKQSERDRLAFFETRGGKAEALEFAKRTYKIYRHALLSSRKRGSIVFKENEPNILMNVQFKNLANGRLPKVHYASDPVYRQGYIESCVVFRQFIYTGDYK